MITFVPLVREWTRGEVEPVDATSRSDRRRLWSRASYGVVLALSLGILGMHVLTAGHGTHPVGSGSTVAAASGAGGGVTLDRAAAVHDLEADAALTAHPTRTVFDGASVLPTTCGPDCATGLGAVCAAVLVVVLLLLRRRPTIGRMPSRAIVHPVRPPGRPQQARSSATLALLCVSRT